MPYVRELVFETKIEPHSWEVAAQTIKRLQKQPRLSVFLGGPNGQMHIVLAEGMGYYVSTFGSGEHEEWLPVDERLSRDWIDAGDLGELPRWVLIPEAFALEVAEHFYEHGTRTSKQKWIKTVELISHRSGQPESGPSH
jgi:hypothetical protein